MNDHKPFNAEAYHAKCVAALRADVMMDEGLIAKLADESVNDMRMALYNSRTMDTIFEMFAQPNSASGSRETPEATATDSAALCRDRL